MPFGAKPRFESVSVTVGNGYRYGLVRDNGSGKSTPMKFLSGRDDYLLTQTTKPNSKVARPTSVPH
jgi:ATPase subunit of ABC transporter with duplicated ATPase domains